MLVRWTKGRAPGRECILTSFVLTGAALVALVVVLLYKHSTGSKVNVSPVNESLDAILTLSPGFSETVIRIVHHDNVSDYQSISTIGSAEKDENEFDTSKKTLENKSETAKGNVVVQIPGPELRIACIGDSITYGNGTHLDPPIVPRNGPDRGNYPLTLAQLLAEPVKEHMDLRLVVRNFGLRGATMMKKRYNTDEWGGREQLSYWYTKEFRAAKAFGAHLIVLMLGTNDSKLHPWSANRQAMFSSDFHDMIAAFSVPTNKNLVKMWIALPPRAVTDEFGIDSESLENVVKVLLREGAANQSLDIIDMAQSMDKRSGEGEDDWSFCMSLDPPSDGIHPCRRAANHIAQAAAGAIASYLKL